MTPATIPQDSPPRLHHILTLGRSPRFRCDITRANNEIRLLDTSDPTNVWNDYAVTPRTPRMTVNIENMWTIYVTNPHGVTIGDVLVQVCSAMKSPLSNPEYNALNSAARTTADEGWQLRAQVDPNALTQGVLRLDVMGQRKYFLGLQASTTSYGVWVSNFTA